MSCKEIREKIIDEIAMVKKEVAIQSYFQTIIVRSKRKGEYETEHPSMLKAAEVAIKEKAQAIKEHEDTINNLLEQLEQCGTK